MTSTGGGGRNKLFLKPDRLLDYMEILRLRRAISLLLEVRKGLSNIGMLRELRLLLHQLGISCSESCEVTINRLKMELESKVERTRRLEKNRKRLRQNGLFQRDAGRFYRELGKQTIQVTSRYPSLRSSSIGVVS